jgi:hypothetical protein
MPSIRHSFRMVRRPVNPAPGHAPKSPSRGETQTREMAPHASCALRNHRQFSYLSCGENNARIPGLRLPSVRPGLGTDRRFSVVNLSKCPVY